MIYPAVKVRRFTHGVDRRQPDTDRPARRVQLTHLTGRLDLGKRLRQLLAAALVLAPLPLSIVTMLCVFAGRAYQLDLAIWPVVGTTIAVMIPGIDFGLLALLVGAHRGSRGHALGLSSALAAASYLVSSLGPVSSLARAVRPASMFYWAIGDNQLETGPTTLGLTVLVAVGLTFFAATRVVVERLDIP